MTEKDLAFIIDSSSLKSMLEKENKGGELLEKLESMKKAGGNIDAFTPLSSFLRSILICDPDIKIRELQRILSFIKIVPMPRFADPTNDKAVRDEVIKFAQAISEMKEKKDE